MSDQRRGQTGTESLRDDQRIALAAMNRNSEWGATIAKVVGSVTHFRLPDMGGVQLLEVMGDSWMDCAEDALATGRWDFGPLRSTFSYLDKLQTFSSVLDRVVVQLALNEPGWRMQNDLINVCTDDELMPIPPAFRFRPPSAKYAYSLWFNDYGLWKDVQRLYRLRGFAWMVKCDIRNCFYSIPRPAAFDVLRRFMPDASRRALMGKRMKYPVEHDGRLFDLPSGLPVGEPSSHLLANGYLAGFDHWVVKHLAVPYARYVDDMRFFCKSKSEAVKVLDSVGECLQVRFGLMLNTDKSAVQELSGEQDSAAAADLLHSMKQRVQEPLEEQPVYYRRVPPEEITGAWNEVRLAMGSNAPLMTIEDSLDLLSRLRPTYGSAPNFHESMSAMLEYTCSIKSDNTEIQRRMASIAMRQMRESGMSCSMAAFRRLADTGVPNIREIAFHNLVLCKEDGADRQAEASILHELESGSRKTAEDRLKCFVKTFALTPKLIDAFSSSEDAEIRAILSGPSSEVPIARAVEQLRDANAQIRRNAALALIRRVPEGDNKTIVEIDRALAKEKHCDARLSMLIARAGCIGGKAAFPALKCHFPKNRLELAICQAVADGKVPRVQPKFVEPVEILKAVLEADMVVPTAYGTGT